MSGRTRTRGSSHRRPKDAAASIGNSEISRVYEPSEDLERATLADGSRITLDYGELVAKLKAQRETAELDEADQRGGIDWSGETPVRIPDNESPLDLAKRTQRRREAKAREQAATITADGILFTDVEPLHELARRVAAQEAAWRKTA